MESSLPPVLGACGRVAWASDKPVVSLTTPIPPDCALRRGTGVDEFESAFPDDRACLAHIFAKRYGQGFSCPKCGNAAEWISLKDSSVYASRCCGRLLYPQRGTIFQRSRKLLLKEWFRGLLFAANSTGTPGAKFYCRYFDLSAKAAVRMANKIRLQMARQEDDRVIGGAGDNIYLSEVSFLRVRRLARTGYKRRRVISLSDGCEVGFVVPESSQASHIMRALAPRVKPDAVFHCADEALFKRLVRCGKGLHKVVRAEPDSRPAAMRSEISVIIAKRVLRRLYGHVAAGQLGTYLNEQSFRANAVRDRSLFWSAIKAFPAPPVFGSCMDG